MRSLLCYKMCQNEWMCQKASRPWMFDLNGVKLETDLIFYHFSKAWGERCRHAARYLTPLMAGRAGSPRHKLCVKYFIFRDVSVASWELKWCCRVWADSSLWHWRCKYVYPIPRDWRSIGNSVIPWSTVNIVHEERSLTFEGSRKTFGCCVTIG